MLIAWHIQKVLHKYYDYSTLILPFFDHGTPQYLWWLPILTDRTWTWGDNWQVEEKLWGLFQPPILSCMFSNTTPCKQIGIILCLSVSFDVSFLIFSRRIKKCCNSWHSVKNVVTIDTMLLNNVMCITMC